LENAILLIPELTIDQRSELLLVAARGLHINGQETSETVRAVDNLSRALSLPATLLPQWGYILLQTECGARKVLLRVEPATPSGIAMNRVEFIMRGMEDVCKGRIAPSQIYTRLALVEKQSGSSLPLFVLACTMGATALGLIFGASDLRAIALIATSAAFGGLVRRLLGKIGAGSVLQALVASLLAGLIGALAVRWHMSSSLRLVAVCPSMILVPGPHILNGALDCISLRVSLGIARLSFGLLIIVAICGGLLVGLGLGGVSLPVSEPGRQVTLWVDSIAAGAAAASYGVYFSMPFRDLAWPVAAGMLAHAARWGAMSVLGASPAVGAGVACLIVGIFLLPLAQRLRLPFAAIGFASVVALIPGIFLFRMSSGLVALQRGFASSNPLLLAQTLSDGVTALLIVIAMILGLTLPSRLYDAVGFRSQGRS
jgi:uncharacterized membrane protein YjjP (DUF1212 family)